MMRFFIKPVLDPFNKRLYGWAHTPPTTSAKRTIIHFAIGVRIAW